MPRPAKFTEDQILDTALRLVADGGPGAATIGAIADALPGPVGSIYHRFRSRDLLLARLWIRTVGRFQQEFLHALDDGDLDRAALGAALSVLAWARDHLDQARVLTLYRRQDLAARWPDELGKQLIGLNRAVESALRDHARRRYGRDDDDAVAQLTFAVVDVPYAAARRYLLTGEPPPLSLDDLVAATCACALAADVADPGRSGRT